MNVVAKKSLGQNFLIDEKILNLIVGLGDINSNDIVLEVGPGTGNLTEKILKKGPKKIIVVEKDANLSMNLKKKFKKDIIVINDDILSYNQSYLYKKKIIIFGTGGSNLGARALNNINISSNLSLEFYDNIDPIFFENSHIFLPSTMKQRFFNAQPFRLDRCRFDGLVRPLDESRPLLSIRIKKGLRRRRKGRFRRRRPYARYSGLCIRQDVCSSAPAAVTVDSVINPKPELSASITMSRLVWVRTLMSWMI